MNLLTEQEITEIVREASRGSATRRDGSTSQRIAIAIESAVLASPVLNRVKAEALRDAADEFDAQGEWKGHGEYLRNMADAIEKGEV